MEKIFNLTSTFKALEEDDGGVHICGMASTHDEDRANDVIMAEAWTKGGLQNFEKNPIILFNHDYNKPIGRATGLKVTENGLELKAKISKSAPDHVAQLVKEGILGAFSVGFRVKDADYLEETDGLKIKDAELFEVSVVSVPCNQAATFSLAKSFDSIDEYNEFKKTFTNRVDLAGQSLAKDEKSSLASETPDEAVKPATKEIKMSEEVQTPEVDLEAFAKKVAEETAAKIAMKQAEQKAAEEKAAQEAEEKAAQEAAEKAAQEEEVQSAIKVGVESGADRLMADIEEKLAAKDADMAEIVAQHKKDLEEKSAELEAMRESKRVFSDRGRAGDLTPFAKDLMGAHILGVITGKGWDTDFAKDTLQKAGVTYTATTSAGIDVTVSQTIEQEIMNELKIARLFREIPVNGGATVLPIQPDSDPAEWTSTGADISLQNKGGSGNNFASSQVILNAYRLISITAIDNNTDEQVLVNLMPMLTDAIARSHARAVESMILNGNGTIAGLAGEANSAAFDYDLSGNGTAPHTNKLTSGNLLDLRQSMGKYGMNPSDVVYIVSQQGYFDLLDDAAFQTLDEVGSDLALRITGTLGAVYGSAVVPSEEMSMTAGNEAAFAVNTRNYVIPRLRGVTVEQDYEVRAQRRVLVASQSLGFEELVAASGGDKPSIKITNVA